MPRHISRNSSRADESRADKRRRSGTLRMLRSEQAGFSIVEVVVAALLLTLLSGAVATALISSARFSGDQRKRTQATAIAQQDQERMKGMSIKALQGLDETNASGPYDGTTYSVRSQGQFLSNAGSASCSTSGTSAAAYVLVTSTVDWADNRRPAVVQKSLIAPRNGGTLLVKSLDQNDLPLPGTTINIFGPKESETSVTSSEGCAVFGGIAATGYYIGAQKAGYVDKDGNDYPFTGATAGNGTTIPTPFKLGLAGSVTANFKTTINGTPANGQKAPSVSWFKSGMTASLNAVPATVPSATIATPTKLFPFNNGTSGVYTNNYELWAGNCDLVKPPSNQTYTTVSPGAAVTLDDTAGRPRIALPALNLQVQWRPNTGSYTTVVPAHIKFTDACNETWSIPAGDIRSTTNATLGSLLFPGQPYAPATPTTSWLTVCADYRINPSSPYYKATSTTANNNYAAATSKTVQIDGSSAANQGTC